MISLENIRNQIDNSFSYLFFFNIRYSYSHMYIPLHRRSSRSLMFTHTIRSNNLQLLTRFHIKISHEFTPRKKIFHSPDSFFPSNSNHASSVVILISTHTLTPFSFSCGERHCCTSSFTHAHFFFEFAPSICRQ